MTFQQICKDVHLVKHQGQQLFIESRAKPPPRPRILGELVTSQSRDEEEEGLRFPLPSLLTHLPFLFLVPATGTFKAKVVPCQSPNPELEVVPASDPAPLALATEEPERKEASGCSSYQQINCLDSILR